MHKYGNGRLLTLFIPLLTSITFVTFKILFLSIKRVLEIPNIKNNHFLELYFILNLLPEFLSVSTM